MQVAEDLQTPPPGPPHVQGLGDGRGREPVAAGEAELPGALLALADVLADPGEIAGAAGDYGGGDDLGLVVTVDLADRLLDRLVEIGLGLHQALPLPRLLELSLPAVAAHDRA